jgi:ketosteroid isomerase-like protein
MRFIFEHPWISSLSIGVVAVGLMWVGLRDGKKLFFRSGTLLFCLAVLAWLVGSAIETPTEHAKRLIDSLVQAVEQKDLPAIAPILSKDVILVDTWKDFTNQGIQTVQNSVEELHSRHSFSFNTMLRFQPVERPDDVLVEVSFLSRVSGIGTVPSRWRILVKPNASGVWKIYSIDAIEIMGRSYR